MNDHEEYTIESTGYSYSGIADVLLNEGDGPSLELLSDLVNKFDIARKECDRLETEFEKAKEHKAVLASCFQYVHKALKLKADEPLVIRVGFDGFFVAKILENDKIHWERYRATIPLNRKAEE